MKSSVCISVACAALAAAYPAAVIDKVAAQVEALKALSAKSLAPRAASNFSFDPSLQLVNVTGENAWQAPGPGDERGPCPGLNALANHGFIPRNGTADILQFVYANNVVYGMDIVLAIVLSVYGAAIDGIGLGWSVGGTNHTGISGARGNYETDSSPCRGDLNQYGSNTDVVISQFKTLLDLQPDPATANYSIEVMAQFRKIRMEESIANNPWFYYGPFSGTVVAQAAYSFLTRFMSNHSAEYPDGILNQEVLKSFYGVSGDNDNLVWTPGYERIPDNWYRRAIGNEYGLINLSEDGNVLEAVAPTIFQPGCNTGTVNSYVYIDGADLGGYNFTSINDGVCIGLAAVLGITNSVSGIGLLIEDLLFPIHASLGCIASNVTNETVTATCPGYSYYGGPDGPIAPGAIQL